MAKKNEGPMLYALHAPIGASSVTHEGVEYQVKDGTVEVPREAVEALKPHGFTQTSIEHLESVKQRIEAEQADADRIAAEQAEAARKQAEDDAEKAAKQAAADAKAALKADEAKNTPNDTGKGAKNAPNAGA